VISRKVRTHVFKHSLNYCFQGKFDLRNAGEVSTDDLRKSSNSRFQEKFELLVPGEVGTHDYGNSFNSSFQAKFQPMRNLNSVLLKKFQLRGNLQELCGGNLRFDYGGDCGGFRLRGRLRRRMWNGIIITDNTNTLSV